MPEVKLIKCDECESTIQEPRRTCKRCLNNMFEREMSDIRAGHIANLIANKYGVDIHLLEEITDKKAMQSVDDYLTEWADEHGYQVSVIFTDGRETVASVWKDGKVLMGDVVKINKRPYKKNGKWQTDNFSRVRGRIIAKLNLYNLWVGGVF